VNRHEQTLFSSKSNLVYLTHVSNLRGRFVICGARLGLRVMTMVSVSVPPGLPSLHVAVIVYWATLSASKRQVESWAGR